MVATTIHHREACGCGPSEREQESAPQAPRASVCNRNEQKGVPRLKSRRCYLSALTCTVAPFANFVIVLARRICRFCLNLLHDCTTNMGERCLVLIVLLVLVYEVMSDGHRITNDWMKLSPPSPPPDSRFLHTMVSNSHDQLVVYGGANLQSCDVHADLWLFDTGTSIPVASSYLIRRPTVGALGEVERNVSWRTICSFRCVRKKFYGYFRRKQNLGTSSRIHQFLRYCVLERGE